MIEIGNVDSKLRYGIIVGDICYDKNVFEPPLILITETFIYTDSSFDDTYHGILANGKGVEGNLKDLKRINKHIDGVDDILNQLNSIQAEFYDC